MTPIPNYAQMLTLQKMVIAENLEQINASIVWHRLNALRHFLGILKAVLSLQLTFIPYMCVIRLLSPMKQKKEEKTAALRTGVFCNLFKILDRERF